MTLQIGQILDGKYRIIRELGSGSMGAVYEGENVRIRRRVAIKVLLSGMARRPDSVQRFEREAQAAGRIGSEHIVEVLDLGTLPDGGFYMVMEFLEGMTLSEHIRSKGRVNPREIVPIVQQLLTGLEMAHEARVIHRDLKPDNIFLVAEHAGQKNFVKILDFGVSKFNPLNVEEGMSMTKTGAVVGTPFYMAPEQAKGSRDVDHRSDLYSVGVILYEAITGQKPFHAGTFNELIFKIVLETPPPPEQFVPNLDPAFGRIVRRSMAREPAERFQKAAEFRDALYIWMHTGKDGSKDQPLNLPPGDFPLDEEGATIVMDGSHRAPQLPLPKAPPPSRKPPAAAPAATPNPQAAFATGGGGLLPPTINPVQPTAPNPLDLAPPAMPRFDSDAPVRLPSASPNMSTAPGGIAISSAGNITASGEDAWPIAGVPPKRSNALMGAILGGAALLIIGTAAVALVYIPSDESSSAEVQTEDDTTAAANTGSEPTSPAAPASSADSGDDDGGEPTANGTASSAPSAEPSDTVAAAPSPKPVAAKPNPRPQPAVRPQPPTSPKPLPTRPKPGPKPKPNGGRPIKVEL